MTLKKFGWPVVFIALSIACLLVFIPKLQQGVRIASRINQVANSGNLEAFDEYVSAGCTGNVEVHTQLAKQCRDLAATFSQTPNQFQPSKPENGDYSQLYR